LTQTAGQGTTVAMSKSQTNAVIALLATMLIWGSGAVFIRNTAVTLGPANSLALRYAIMALILLPIMAYTGGWRIAKADWPRLLVVSIVGMAGYNWFVNEGFARVPAGLGTVITMVEPIMIAILAWMLLREKLTASIFVGLAISLVGGLVLFWPDLMQATANPVDPVGVGALMIACLGWAIYTIVAKPLLEKYSGFDITAMTFLLSAPIFIPLATKPIMPLFAELTPRLWGELFFLTVPNAFIATLMWNYGARHLSGAVVGSFLYLIPVVAVTCGALILDEAVTIHLVAGGLLILAGVAYAQYAPSLMGQPEPDA
jgi:drug/metabolite transporter (DMT)-like permease